ncbi:endonuclease SmrB [Candidatus Doolittlea endobia]|uniref:Ribosome rescue factor SmrB n=1 Tax=Candidatus Doolittlea endobia TaxID=1778262 RepID=A0A143WRU2_9ENTR|nr:endonuclease SmrB [Candidatus Doolittlea endobia]CUX96403.1 Endonuclease MutS2 [Candidatus Doolittlea endobia]
MKKRYALAEDELQLFRQTVEDTKPLFQDRVKPSSSQRTQIALLEQKFIQKQVDANFYFSDAFQPLLQQESPLCYARSDVSSYEIKKLQRGDYTPELFLDLHGLNQTEAKKELGVLIAACRREHVHCACVMHGHGKHILKQQIPLWLAQHLDIRGLHQAPKKLGGSAALLILVELEY